MSESGAPLDATRVGSPPRAGRARPRKEDRLLPAALVSCSHCGQRIPKKTLKLAIIERLARTNLPEKKKLEVVRAVFPEDTPDPREAQREAARRAWRERKAGGQPAAMRGRGRPRKKTKDASEARYA